MLLTKRSQTGGECDEPNLAESMDPPTQFRAGPRWPVWSRKKGPIETDVKRARNKLFWFDYFSFTS